MPNQTAEFFFGEHCTTKKLKKLEAFLSQFGNCVQVSNCGVNQPGRIVLSFTTTKDELVDSIVKAKDARKILIEQIVHGSDVAYRLLASMRPPQITQWGV